MVGKSKSISISGVRGPRRGVASDKTGKMTWGSTVGEFELHSVCNGEPLDMFYVLSEKNSIMRLLCQQSVVWLGLGHEKRSRRAEGLTKGSKSRKSSKSQNLIKDDSRVARLIDCGMAVEEEMYLQSRSLEKEQVWKELVHLGNAWDIQVIPKWGLTSWWLWEEEEKKGD